MREIPSPKKQKLSSTIRQKETGSWALNSTLDNVFSRLKNETICDALLFSRLGVIPSEKKRPWKWKHCRQKRQLTSPQCQHWKDVLGFDTWTAVELFISFVLCSGFQNGKCISIEVLRSYFKIRWDIILLFFGNVLDFLIVIQFREYSINPNNTR